MSEVIIKTVNNLFSDNKWAFFSPIFIEFDNLYYLDISIIPPINEKRKHIFYEFNH